MAVADVSAERQASGARQASSSSSSSDVQLQALVFAARAMRVQGQLPADMIALQEESNNQNEASRGLVVLQEYVVKEAAEAADLISKLASAYRPQQMGSGGGLASPSSSSSSYMTDLSQLQTSWKKALEIWEQGAVLAAMINMPQAANIVMLSTELVQQLAQQQTAFGDACCVELALAGLCNNPSCAALGKSNEARVIMSTCSRCKTAR
jgi:hypothetical protein